LAAPNRDETPRQDGRGSEPAQSGAQIINLHKKAQMATNQFACRTTGMAFALQHHEFCSVELPLIKVAIRNPARSQFFTDDHKSTKYCRGWDDDQNHMDS
jgi:hypothetical protein